MALITKSILRAFLLQAVAGVEGSVGYSGSIMSHPSPHEALTLTRQLVEIESTTYQEGAVGDFLAELLAGRGWRVEKTPVPQPAESASQGPRWNVYGGPAEGSPDLVFSTHMDTVPPYVPFREDAEFLYGRWLPASGEEARDFPLYAQRVRFFPDVPEHEAVTDVFLPLK